jgi:hypothetical protein
MHLKDTKASALNVSNFKIYKQAYKAQNDNARSYPSIITLNLNQLILYYVNASKKP